MPNADFLDRSLIDHLAYALTGGAKLRSDIYDLIKKANYTRVFFLEQLTDYCQDDQRKEDPVKAKILHDKLYELYDHLGCDIVTVPPVSVDERLELILNEIKTDKSREIEGKFKASIEQARQALGNYYVENQGAVQEKNLVYYHKGWVLRLRDNGKYILTIKGPDQGKEFNDRFEFETDLTKEAYAEMEKFPAEKTIYKKKREVYTPLGDQSCTICLDQVEDLGEFVEIEASTENQILLWKKRLGIKTEALKQSYTELIRQ